MKRRAFLAGMIGLPIAAKATPQNTPLSMAELYRIFGVDKVDLSAWVPVMEARRDLDRAREDYVKHAVQPWMRRYATR